MTFFKVGDQIRALRDIRGKVLKGETGRVVAAAWFNLFEVAFDSGPSFWMSVNFMDGNLELLPCK